MVWKMKESLASLQTKRTKYDIDGIIIVCSRARGGFARLMLSILMKDRAEIGFGWLLWVIRKFDDIFIHKDSLFDIHSNFVGQQCFLMESSPYNQERHQNPGIPRNDKGRALHVGVLTGQNRARMENFASFFECHLCLRLLSEERWAVTTPCGHTMCVECRGSVLAAGSGARCPDCRMEGALDSVVVNRAMTDATVAFVATRQVEAPREVPVPVPVPVAETVAIAEVRPFGVREARAVQDGWQAARCAERDAARFAARVRELTGEVATLRRRQARQEELHKQREFNTYLEGRADALRKDQPSFR